MEGFSSRESWRKEGERACVEVPAFATGVSVWAWSVAQMGGTSQGWVLGSGEGLHG